MPPLYHRVWQYLKYRANHEEATIQLKDGSFLTIGQGQLLTSMKTIARDVGWKERGKFYEPNKKSISTVLGWLKEQKMIEIRPVTGNGGEDQFGNDHSNGKSNAIGTLISLINWGFYQIEPDSGNGSSNEVSNDSYPLPGERTRIKELKEAATAGAQARDSINLSDQSQESTKTPHEEVEEAFIMIHRRHFSGVDWPLLSQLFQEGIPHTFIIETMRTKHEARSKHVRVHSFSYYVEAIRDEWNRALAKEHAAKTAAPDPTLTTPARSGTVALGQAQTQQPQYFTLDEDDEITRLMRMSEAAHAQHRTP